MTAGAGSIKEEHYTFFWFGKSSEEPRIYGTAYAVLTNLLFTTQTPHAVNDRIFVLKLNLQYGRIRILNVYAPNIAVSADDKDWFIFNGRYYKTVILF